MTLRKILFTGLRILVLSVIYLLLFMVTSNIGVPEEVSNQLTAEQAQAAMMAMPLVAILNTTVVAYLVLRSRWYGWRLTLVLAFVFFGVYSLLQQIETSVFPAVADRMPPGMLFTLLWTGALFAVVFAPLAVLVMGKWKPGAETARPKGLSTSNLRRDIPLSEWLRKLAVIVVLYEVIYFFFGYYVAWRTPGLPEFYGGSDPGTFFGQLGNVMRDTPWLPLLQVGRALLWTLFALPIVRMLKGPAWETSLALGLFFSVTVASTLFIPNPYMPDYIARGHQIELALSNFVFGALLAGVLLWQPRRGLKPSVTSHKPQPGMN